MYNFDTSTGVLYYTRSKQILYCSTILYSYIILLVPVYYILLVPNLCSNTMKKTSSSTRLEQCAIGTGYHTILYTPIETNLCFNSEKTRNLIFKGVRAVCDRHEVLYYTMYSQRKKKRVLYYIRWKQMLYHSVVLYYTSTGVLYYSIVLYYTSTRVVYYTRINTNLFSNTIKKKKKPVTFILNGVRAACNRHRVLYAPIETNLCNSGKTGNLIFKGVRAVCDRHYTKLCTPIKTDFCSKNEKKRALYYTRSKQIIVQYYIILVPGYYIVLDQNKYYIILLYYTTSIGLLYYTRIKTNLCSNTMKKTSSSTRLEQCAIGTGYHTILYTPIETNLCFNSEKTRNLIFKGVRAVCDRHEVLYYTMYSQRKKKRVLYYIRWKQMLYHSVVLYYTSTGVLYYSIVLYYTSTRVVYYTRINTNLFSNTIKKKKKPVTFILNGVRAACNRHRVLYAPIETNLCNSGKTGNFDPRRGWSSVESAPARSRKNGIRTIGLKPETVNRVYHTEHRRSRARELLAGPARAVPRNRISWTISISGSVSSNPPNDFEDLKREIGT